MATTDLLDPQPMIISLRAYAESAPRFIPPGDGDPKTKTTPQPSPWSLTFDTETTVDAGQALRFGSYQVRYDSELREAGLFYEPDTLAEEELAILRAHAIAHGLKLLTRDSFVEEVFYAIGYELNATIIGLNLPFDLARIAIRHASARGDMRGGFSLTLSADKRRPPVQVKHVSRRTSLIRFAAPFRQRKARSERKRKDYVPVRRGFFVDIGTFAGALFARSFTLASLAEFLDVLHRKLETDEHGQSLTDAYVAYAVRDVQTTWECYAALVERYRTFNLADTPPHAIFSEASIGKAYLNAMRVQPWRAVQTDRPPELLGIIMNSYFGGRSEVRIRREQREVVLCDFLSMYPTVCTLMRLWPFVIAKGMVWRDTTEETRRFLDAVTLADLQRPETWPHLLTLARVEPDNDVFPVRAMYEDEDQATIGLNPLSADRPLWFTLADCVVSKLLTGRAPRVVEAIAFEPGGPQSDLRQVAIAGNPDYAVDPVRDDFFKRLIELRQAVKRRRNAASGAEKDALDAEQNALKIAANATSYGVFVEINVKERAKTGQVTVHTATADPYTVAADHDEEPGRYFHPLLATLIRGAARLMLATAERLILDEGLEWAFCDTDSMAVAKPEGMDDAEFQIRVDRIVEWFAGLNPYDFGGSILKVEDQNYSLGEPGRRETLYCWAISAKRYVLFNIDGDGRPVLRKGSAHGLGHIRAPYDATNPAKGVPAPVASDIGVELWQHDLWWTIACAALDGHPDQVDLSYHPELDQPAVSRYAATTPPILKWMQETNRNQPYARQVKPFGFLLSFFADPFFSPGPSPVPEGAERARRARPCRWRPIAPFDQDHAKAVKAAFDRETGEPVPGGALHTVAEAVSAYHLHPESKFLNADYLDRGFTRRRHVFVSGARHIGKEANRWEEQHFLGFDEDAQPDYGLAPEDMEVKLMVLRATAQAFGMRALARRAGMSPKVVRRAVRSVVFASPPVIERLLGAAEGLEGEAAERAKVNAEVLDWTRQQIAAEGIGAFARRNGVDARNLSKTLSGRRPLSEVIASKLKKANR